MKKRLFCTKLLAFGKIPLILLALFIIPTKNHAQECGTITQPNNVAANFNCTNIPLDLGNPPNLPIQIIKVNIHWVTNKNNQNFTPDGSNGTINGNQIAQDLIFWANYNLSNVSTNPLYSDPGKNFVGDARIRYEIYSNPNNPADLNGGIWYWDKNFKDKEINSYPYKDKVLNIVMHDNAVDDAYNGEAILDKSRIYLYRVQEKFYNNATNIYFFPKVMNHELGHMCGLGHSFENVPCAGIDIDPILECNATPPSIACSNGTSGSTNMMGYNAEQKSLSPCQWQKFYSFLAKNSVKWVKPPCAETIETSDIIIDGHTETVWDEIKYINANIIIKTGSQLTLECKLFLGLEKRIIVERGAKLYVNSGTISSLCDGFWDGIHVHGNVYKEQPIYSTQFNALAADDAGIVEISNASLIENARIAISTDAPGMSYPDQVARWGGVVHVQESRFENNKKVAAFMKYPKTGFIKNKSLFYHNTISIDNSTNTIDPIGVTIWDTHGVTFSWNTFEKGLTHCIFGIDYSATVKQNNFYDVKNAHILMESTTSGGGSKETIIDDNTFYGKNATVSQGIISWSDNNAPRTLSITNNRFDGNILYGIKIISSTPLRISGNTFAQKISIFSIELDNTSENSDFASIVNCNTFVSTQNAISLRDDNKDVYFPGNIFEHGGSAIGITNYIGSPLAKVGMTQSWAQLDASQKIELKKYPSSNAFENVATRIFANSSRADEFDYYTPPVAKKVQFADYFPDNAGQVFDLKESTNDPVLDCAKVTIAPTDPPNNLPPPCTPDRVTTIREQLIPINQQINANQQDSPLLMEREILQTDLYETIRCTSVRYLDEGNSIAAEDFLLAQPEPSFKRTVYSLKIKRGDYQGARNLLNALPTQSEYDEQFKQIQDINLKRYNFETQYQLSAVEEVFLTNIANEASINSGYARALLDLLLGYREYNEDKSAYRSQSDYNKAKIKVNTRKESVFIAPNPVQDDMMYVYTKDTKISKGKIQLSNLLGRVAFEQTFTATSFDRIVVEIPHLEPSLYAIRITDGDFVLYEGKVSILK
jgi:hypothetical protein